MANPTQFDVYLYIPTTSAGNYYTRKLHCEQIQLITGRKPMIMPMPGIRMATTGEPLAFCLDFGSMTEDIIVRGDIHDTETYTADEQDKSTPYVRWDELEEIWRTSWRHYTMGLYPTAPLMLVYYDDAGAYYDHYVLPGNLRLGRDPGLALWTYNATFYSVSWTWT